MSRVGPFAEHFSNIDHELHMAEMESGHLPDSRDRMLDRLLNAQEAIRKLIHAAHRRDHV